MGKQHARAAAGVENGARDAQRERRTAPRAHNAPFARPLARRPAPLLQPHKVRDGRRVEAALAAALHGLLLATLVLLVAARAFFASWRVAARCVGVGIAVSVSVCIAIAVGVSCSCRCVCTAIRR